MRDMTGLTFGRLTAIRVAESRGQGRARTWLCQCSCGKTHIADGTYLRNGTTRSCGCLRTELLKSSHTTHGRSQTKEYRTWTALIQRCKNARLPDYVNYGGRGIAVCPEWRASFEAFFRDMGPAPTPSHTIERVNNDAGYSAENCRWLPRAEQNRNKRSNRRLTFQGETRTLADWARRLGLKRTTLAQRLDARGWSVEKALTTPPLRIRRR